MVAIRLGDGASVEVRAGVTVLDVLRAGDNAAAEQALAARVDGREVDLSYPIEGAADGPVRVEPILARTARGLEVLRHSAAHLLAAAVLDLFPGTKLGVGPAIMDDPRYGFFYDVIAPRQLTEDDLPVIEKRMRELAARGLPYRRDEIPKSSALELFACREPLKCELIEEKVDGEASVYYIDGSPFVDFCLGPHVPDTGRLRAFKLLSLARAYWKGDASRPLMQRLYGIAFATQEELDAWLRQREEAERRDHRRLGRQLDLFSLQEQYGQGLIFWHPKGGIVRKEMEDYLRRQLLERGYGLVFTPHVAKRDLWVTSGHEENYAEGMFAPTEIEGTQFRLKPMNCPFHIGIYRSQRRSYRDLPIRLAELGTVYRAELSGVLHGLLRARGFTQDDAHIFCAPESVTEEVGGCVDFAFDVFRTFGFARFKVELSVRGADTSKRFLGSDEDWARAEGALGAALDARGISYERVDGEAAFYGPKIDIKVEDAIGRLWQLTTVQFDFNLPERFGLEYVGEDNRPRRPVMIHRALFGSLERFFGVLVEHYAGAFPVWLAPVQVAVLPVTDRVNGYARDVARALAAAGLRAEINSRNDKLNAKIRDAEVQKVPFMLVLGDREKADGTVAVRERLSGNTGAVPLAEFVEKVAGLRDARAA